MNKCLFLDRDGTINVFNRGYNYLPEHVFFIPGVEKFIKRFSDAGYLVIVITNQGGIGRGVYTEEQMHEVHRYMDSHLREHGSKIDAFYFCPHTYNNGAKLEERQCECKKPGTKMVEDAVRDFNIDKSKSIFVGDNYTDYQCAKNAGVPFYPFAFRDVIGTGSGFRFVIEEYTDSLIEDIFSFAKNL